MTVSSLMRWRFSLSSLMSRFRQVWWVVFVKFHEISQQIWRLIIDAARQIENRHTSLDNREWACVIRQDGIRRSEKLTMRWSSMITRMNRLRQLLQKTNLNRISQITSHTSRQNLPQYSGWLCRHWSFSYAWLTWFELICKLAHILVV
jgi:integrase